MNKDTSRAGKRESRGREASVHGSREAERRAAETVRREEDTPWVRGASLEMPPARAGMDQRWIRVAVGDKDDQRNWARKQREGWKPRPADSVGDFPVPTVANGRFAGCIMVEGSVLCERPMSLSKRRQEHFARENRRRTEAIYADLAQLNAETKNRAFGPVQMAIKSEVGTLREVPVQPD